MRAAGVAADGTTLLPVLARSGITSVLEVHTIIESGRPSATLVLPFDERKKSRLRLDLEDGETLGLFMPPGTILRDGTLLQAADGRVFAVVAADEPVSTITSDDVRLLARVAYHLGNRHIPVEVGLGFVRYIREHVLDEMVTRLGASVAHGTLPFEPEAGAYADADGSGHA